MLATSPLNAASMAFPKDIMQVSAKSVAKLMIMMMNTIGMKSAFRCAIDSYPMYTKIGSDNRRI